MKHVTCLYLWKGAHVHMYTKKYVILSYILTHLNVVQVSLSYNEMVEAV